MIVKVEMSIEDAISIINDRTEIDDVCSNFDGATNQAILAELQKEESWAGYPGWNFYALVFVKDGAFCILPKVRLVSKPLIVSDSWEDAKEQLCDTYGWE